MRQVNKTLSQYDQHIITTVHSLIYHQVDCKAVLNGSNQVVYTTKDDPHNKRYMGIIEATRIYTDMYGDPKLRWQVSKNLLRRAYMLRRIAKQRQVNIRELRKQANSTGEI